MALTLLKPIDFDLSHCKIIDWQRKGNTIRFYMGNENLRTWTGDDFNDAPYEYNAETVYDKYVDGILNCSFDFDDDVYEPADIPGGSWYSKDDLIARKAPILVVSPHELHNHDFNQALADEKTLKVYMGDRIAWKEELE
jgi:hypothetical protein